MTTKLEIANEVREMTVYKDSFGSFRPNKPVQGQFLVTGMQAGSRNSLDYIGYCVQIRKGCGQFGSDMYFLRRPDGGLTTHENQTFYAMTEEQEQLARTIFDVLPEDEDYSQGFKCCERILEIGFIIENSKSKASDVQDVVSLKITSGNETTMVAFI